MPDVPDDFEAKFDRATRREAEAKRRALDDEIALSEAAIRLIDATTGATNLGGR